MTIEQIKVLRQVASIVIEAVQSAGALGAPAGPLYASMMSQGCTLNQFEQIMSALVQAGKLTKSGHCYFFKSSI